MMNTEEEPPPKPTDLDGWRRAIADGSYRAFRMEAVVAAIQDLGPNADEAVINSLALHADGQDDWYPPQSHRSAPSE